MKEEYKFLNQQLQSLIKEETREITILANTAALLNETLPKINWVGYYLYEQKEDILYLGPFQGKPACTTIPMGKGVCGTAAEKLETITVDNVHHFPGHIACDSASNAEIVIPISVGGKLYGVLDIDSPIFNRFDEEDREVLENFVLHLEKRLTTILT